jgi:enoyl-CoA hydratase
MGVSTSFPEKGIAVVTVGFPPVNALPVTGWFDLADAVRSAGRAPEIRCVVLAAEGAVSTRVWTSRRYRPRAAAR